VLDLLDQYGVQATFFTWEEAERYQLCRELLRPEVTRLKIIANGIGIIFIDGVRCSDVNWKRKTHDPNFSQRPCFRAPAGLRNLLPQSGELDDVGKLVSSTPRRSM
jgi:hypothetical protein